MKILVSVLLFVLFGISGIFYSFMHQEKVSIILLENNLRLVLPDKNKTFKELIVTTKQHQQIEEFLNNKEKPKLDFFGIIFANKCLRVVDSNMKDLFSVKDLLDAGVNGAFIQEVYDHKLTPKDIAKAMK